MQIEEYRKRLEKFEESLNRELHRYCSGQKPFLEISGVYSDYSDLYSVEAFREAESEYVRTPESFPSRRKSLEKIRALIVDRHIDSKAIAVTQQIANAGNRTIPWRGAEIPLARVPGLLAQEPDFSARRALADTYDRALGESEDLHCERIARLNQGAGELGFKNFLDASARATGVDYRQLRSSLEAFVADSEPEYFDRLRNALEQTPGIDFKQAQRWDIARWLRHNEPAATFDRAGLVSALEETISRLGVRPERAGSISLDLEIRPSKRPGAFCVPIRIPFEIEIVILPSSGYADYAALFHEAGHAHHFAWTSAGLPVEDRIYGDPALAETYGFLLERITRERLWLQEVQDYLNSGPFLRSRALFDAYQVRRHFAKLSFEIQLYGGAAAADARLIYPELMTGATGVRYSPEQWLGDLDDPFCSAGYLRARMFEAMLREHLRIRFGSDWFHSCAAGNFLKEIWETGQYYTAGQLSREIGLGDLDPQVLAESLREAISA